MLDYLKTHSLNTLAEGRHEIDGEEIFLMIVTGEMRPASEGVLEVHDRYFDVQIPLLQPERFGLASRARCRAPRGTMDTAADILFFDDSPRRYADVGPGELIVFTPETAHAPMIGRASNVKRSSRSNATNHLKHQPYEKPVQILFCALCFVGTSGNASGANASRRQRHGVRQRRNDAHGGRQRARSRNQPRNDDRQDW